MKKKSEIKSSEMAVLTPRDKDRGVDIIGTYNGLHFIVQCKCQKCQKLIQKRSRQIGQIVILSYSR